MAAASVAYGGTAAALHFASANLKLTSDKPGQLAFAAQLDKRSGMGLTWGLQRARSDLDGKPLSHARGARKRAALIDTLAYVPQLETPAVGASRVS